ncbi:MAG: glycerol-3-phosphate acyltransferase [Sinobacteraceae bacterium]|nr:glycerol-3-phosphate acyltransferase [Nevskiaceae bacterium]
MIEALAKGLIAYLLGGMMGGDLMRGLFGGGDLRAAGSGNVGATNALRTRGPAFALGVLAIDAGKGVAAALALPPLPWPWVENLVLPHGWIAYGCGACCALGHCYPLAHRFRGGKGVATLAGVYGALLPGAFVWMFLAFALTVMLTGYVALASLAGALTALLIVAVSGDGIFSAAGAFTLAMVLLVGFKHRENLARLRRGTEHRFEKAMVLRRWLAR